MKKEAGMRQGKMSKIVISLTILLLASGACKVGICNDGYEQSAENQQKACEQNDAKSC
jgi:hypothetical protein